MVGSPNLGGPSAKHLKQASFSQEEINFMGALLFWKRQVVEVKIALFYPISRGKAEGRWPSPYRIRASWLSQGGAPMHSRERGNNVEIVI